VARTYDSRKRNLQPGLVEPPLRISFEEPFYLDIETRIANDVLMRRGLYEWFGIGDPDPQPRPIIGSRHIAAGS